MKAVMKNQGNYKKIVKKNMIYSKQFGFRSNHSTNHAIISITENIRHLLDNGHYVCGIFVDLEKADKEKRFHFNDFFEEDFFHWDTQTTQHINSPKIQENA